MKKFILILLLFSLSSYTQTMPCDAPPTIMRAVKPNLIFLLDISLSMYARAYWFGSGDPRTNYNPNMRYYGYFHPDSIYVYSDPQWVTTGQGANGDYRVTTTNFDFKNKRILGNILNWATMSRWDIMKKVLVGGEGNPTSDYVNEKLQSRGGYTSGDDGWPTPLITLVSDSTVQYRFDRTSQGATSIVVDSFYNGKWKKNFTASLTKIDVSTLSTDYRIGILAKIGDQDLDRKWDGGNQIPRFAVMVYTEDSKENKILKLIKDNGFSANDSGQNAAELITGIKEQPIGYATNVGDAILQAIHYFASEKDHFGNYNKFPDDPYLRKVIGNIYDTLWCAHSFVVLLGDGQANRDQIVTTTDYSGTHRIPVGYRGDIQSLCSYNNNLTGYDTDSWDDVNSKKDCSDDGYYTETDHRADDYAYYAHVTDLRVDGGTRTPSNLKGEQKLTFYTVFCFGKGANLFKSIAKWGGFNDRNLDKLPQRDEYDENNDGVPDKYYEAETGDSLESSIRKIIYEVMATVSSGTATAIVATGTRGEGVGTYAMYYPRKFYGQTAIDWIGMLHGVWVDPFGNLREETEGNLQMHLKNDFVIRMEYDTASGETKVLRYRDINGDNKNLQFVDQVNYDNLKTIFDLGKYLLDVSSNIRNIWTFINNTEIEFKAANKNIIKPYLDVSTDGEADTLIRYIRGENDFGFRNRKLPDNRLYKLGDIMFSSPLVVGPPMERYDLLYGDTSYMSYFRKYNFDEKRRSVVYAGANDGMLHCVNIGLYYTDSGVVAGHLDPAGHTPGKELWAYIPFNLLPHLKWLKEKEYCHVYYVDLKPYPTDAKIFTADNTHINGWGTVLISGFRMGGTKYTLPGGTILSSGYACIDVTNPLNPDVLWEWKIPEYTYSTSYPNVIKVQNNWYMIVGTGPTQFNGYSSINAKLYVLNLSDGSVVKTFTLSEPRSAIGDIISVDLDLDYNVDLVYFGTYYDAVGNIAPADFRGNLYRLNTRESADPNNWTLTKLFGPTRPITAAPAATLDEQGKLWIYFGTGKYFSSDDVSDKTTEYFYGIKDTDTSSTVSISELQNVTNVKVYGPDSVTGLSGVKNFNELETFLRGKKGWYRVLSFSGEKSFTRPYVIGGTLVYTTFTPTGDICEATGKGRLYALYYYTGTAYKNPILPKNPITGEHEVLADLGPGLPAEPSLYVGPTDEKIYIQISGAVKQIENINLVMDPRGGLIMWKRR